MAPPTAARFADALYGRVIAGAVGLAVTALAWYFLIADLPFEPTGYLVGRDFVNTWMGARAALEGEPQLWFDTDAYNAALKETWGPEFPEHHWSYPPHLLLATWPLGFMSYLPAYALWCVAGFVLFMAAAAGGERRPDRLLLLAAAPAVVVNIIGGQNGFFTAALLIGGLTLLEKRPVVAGVLFGVLTMKPQLGLLLPLMLALSGQWKCIGAAAATALILAGVTSALFGADVWPRYFSDSVPGQNYWLMHGGGIFPSMMPTAFMNARIAGLPLAWAWSLQGLVSAAAIAAVTWTFWRRRDPTLSAALFLAASFLVTPYAFNYDMVVFGWVVARLRDRAQSRLDDAIALAVWTLPATTMLLGFMNVPLSSLVLAAFAARLVRRLSRATEPAYA